MRWFHSRAPRGVLTRFRSEKKAAADAAAEAAAEAVVDTELEIGIEITILISNYPYL